MKELARKYRKELIFIVILIAVIFFFLFRESELKQDNQKQREYFKKQLIEARKQNAKEAEVIEQKAFRTITIYKDRNVKRKNRQNEKAPQIIAPSNTNDILAILNSAKRKL